MTAPQPLRDASLEPFLSLRLAVRARALVHLTHVDDLPAVLAVARRDDLPVRVLGGGSNLAPDGDVEALVLRVATRGISATDAGDHTRVAVAAGEDWHGLVRWSIARGLGGLENLALIPGTVGAAPVQNIGAYGAELAPLVEAVHVHHLADNRADDRAEVLDRDACGFGYRDSIFKGSLDGQVLITRVDLRLPRVAAGAWQAKLAYGGVAAELAALGWGAADATPARVAEAVVRIRRRRLPDPRRQPNVGSFFKNPVLGADAWAALQARVPDVPGWPMADGGAKVPAAWLIEAAGLRGADGAGGVAVSPRHALVLTATPGAAPGALHALAARVRACVLERFGVALEQEPRALR